MGWTAVPFRKFQLPPGGIAEVNFCGRAFALALLTVIPPAGYTASDQPGQSTISAVVNVSAED